MKAFVDSNLPMDVEERDHPMREPARRSLSRARTGEIDASTSTEVFQEILDRSLGLERPDLTREIFALFERLCPVVLPVTLAATDRVHDLLRAVDGLSVRDAVHAGVALNHEIANGRRAGGPRECTFDSSI